MADEAGSGDGLGRDDASAARNGGKVRLTITDIARMAGVSKKTVSRVINHSGLVKEETRERILAIVNKHGYQPDPQARALALRRSTLVALISNQPNPQYIVDIQGGILEGMAGTPYQLVIRPCDRTSPTLYDDICDIVLHQKLFGVILTPSISEDDELIGRLRQIGCPYVRIAAVSLDSPENMIETHDYVGAAEAARHIAELGHQRIAHIRGPETFLSAAERLRGFRVGLAEFGMKVEDRYLKYAGYTFESGMECGKQLLGMDVPPTAIFTGNDEMAIGVYQAVRQAGLRIPEDLSIVGFDDSPMATRIWPPLTTVRLPIVHMGRIAVQLLVSNHDRVSMSPPPATSVMPSLVVRESTGRPRE
ncbi:MAG TPA: LacI family DNA-binding transcriptional regulator [Woeseiaceae bacterium]|nr:LacI family DNA-binding transcriptional regulator [Woeseiaceae bacterium]